MFSSFILFLTRLGWRNILLAICIAILAVIGWRKWIATDAPPPPIISLMKEMEFVEELRLVTYYSEELLEIGVQDVLGRELIKKEVEVERARKDSADLHTQLLQAGADLVYYQSQLENAEKEKVTLEASLQKSKDEKPSASRWGKIKKRLEENPQIYGSQVGHQYRLYVGMRGNRTQQKVHQDAIMELVKPLEIAAEKAMDLASAQMEALNASIKQFKDEIKRIEKRQTALAKQAAKATVTARSAESALSILRQQTDYDQESNPPNMVAVVQSGVTAYVDLSGMELTVKNDTLFITQVKQATVDCNIALNLDPHKRYRLTDQKGGGADAEKGMYYRVYREMQRALQDMKYEVIEHALNRGIRQEADSLADAYLKQMGQSLSFPNVVISRDTVVNRTNCEIGKQAEPIAAANSTEENETED